ncbi:glucose-1-phosphate thymidylyltransferase RfbA [Streptomyces sp. SID161]|uniref:glucose-1-phosphate thymidylyltransferase RfbA n=1 Tax=Streptomyces sp. SID161 TaxID=2690251 RepID=UPI00136C5B2C|nr:glucose-1-phosphate thymidylyltransferase RfbA [Streptomyces sp. SID161]MYW46129.1 glucose-1-phosphate thymidylyltransferase RfbA [Streptomyces sp. SID161]
MRAILLAGGVGSRLWPATRAVSKQLIPVFDKPMIYYPLSTLLLAGIREILVVTTPEDQDSFQRLLGDGAQLGVRLEYAVQPYPGGLAEAFVIGAEFIGDGPVTLILGDNIFQGVELDETLEKFRTSHGAHVFARAVADPSAYGVVEFDESGNARSLTEKPSAPASKYAIPGLYFYDNNVVDISKRLKPSARGELEITDVNAVYLDRGELHVSLMGRGTAWLDTGTFESLARASEFVRVVEERQGVKLGCVEEAAWRAGFIDDVQLLTLAEPLVMSGYGRYLIELVEEARCGAPHSPASLGGRSVHDKVQMSA